MKMLDVLNKIKEINKTKPAQQADLLEALHIEPAELNKILNELYVSNLISAGHLNKTKDKGGPYISDFADITTYNT